MLVVLRRIIIIMILIFQPLITISLKNRRIPVCRAIALAHTGTAGTVITATGFISTRRTTTTSISRRTSDNNKNIISGSTTSTTRTLPLSRLLLSTAASAAAATSRQTKMSSSSSSLLSSSSSSSLSSSFSSSSSFYGVVLGVVRQGLATTTTRRRTALGTLPPLSSSSFLMTNTMIRRKATSSSSSTTTLDLSYFLSTPAPWWSNTERGRCLLPLTRSAFHKSTSRILARRSSSSTTNTNDGGGDDHSSSSSTTFYDTTTEVPPRTTTDNEDQDEKNIENNTQQQQQQQTEIGLLGQQQEQGRGSFLSRKNCTTPLDGRTIADHLDIVISHLQARQSSKETIDAAYRIATMMGQRNIYIQQRDMWLQKRNEATSLVGQFLQQQNKNKNKNNKTINSEEQKEQSSSIDQQQQDDDNDEQLLLSLDEAKKASTMASEQAAVVEQQLDLLQKEIDQLVAIIPNLLDDIVPYGMNDQENVEIYQWGNIHTLPSHKVNQWMIDFQPKWHDDIANGFNGYKVDAAVAISGTRFIALSGVIAQLERAIGMYFMDLHTSPQHGYTEVSVPLVVSRSTLMGTGQLPKFQEDLFAITPTSHTCNGEDAFLIPTAEVPVTNLHRNGGVLEESDLPISYVAWTPCFRAEAGSYGRDTRGLIRTHQFYKVELVKITTAESSKDQHELLTQHAENCLQALELPYRKVRLCSGDIGFGATHCYDLEVWLPGSGEYREISSCSNTGDFQARRMGLRYRPSPPPTTTTSNTDNSTGSSTSNKKKKSSSSNNVMKPQFCHTINGSGLAVGRTLVAILENYQLPNGNVIVPKVLRPYMGGKEILEIPITATTTKKNTD